MSDGVDGAAHTVTQQVPVVTVTASDTEQGVELSWTAELLPGGLIRQRTTLRNLPAGNLPTGDLEVGKVELGFPLPALATEILTTTGHHLRERSPQRQPLTEGRFEKVSMAGRPGFDASLLLSVGEPGFGFEHGEVYSVHVGWSGNSVLSAERQPYTTGLIGGGEVLLGGEATLARGETYTTPWLYGSYGDGLNEVAARFHDYVRSCHPDLAVKPRPVILNTWEAVYFDHDYDTLKALADKAGDSGVERFVVDDGWFGSRRDSTSGLGDWQIAQDVWPDGPKSLKALADYVHGKGMEFGLWFEPEMVNPDSDLFRRHPEWVMQAGARLPELQRHQLVLDLTNPDASDYVFDAMSAILSRNAIDYVKWDHNRDLLEAGTNQYGGRAAVHEQTVAYYRLLDRLRGAFPNVQWESCASGGGRIDLGVVEHVSRFWTSDMTDALSRQRIQRWTVQSIAPEYLGAHVSAPTSHQTGRTYTLAFRAATAVFFGFGIEWDIRQASDDDLRQLSEWIAWYKEQRRLLHSGRFFNVDINDGTVMAYGVAAEDGSQALLAHVQLDEPKHNRGVRVRVPGLVSDAEYSLRWAGPEPASAALEQLDPFGPLGRRTVTGAYLGLIGIRFPRCNPQTVRLVSVTRCQKEIPSM